MRHKNPVALTLFILVTPNYEALRDIIAVALISGSEQEPQRFPSAVEDFSALADFFQIGGFLRFSRFPPLWRISSF
jgi:hypothetical protein